MSHQWKAIFIGSEDQLRKTFEIFYKENSHYEHMEFYLVIKKVQFFNFKLQKFKIVSGKIQG